MRQQLKRIIRKLPYVKALESAVAHKDSQISELSARVTQLEEVERAWVDPRTSLARRYVRGYGIEIGAAHMPVILPEKATAKYVDMVSTEDLKKLWPEIANFNPVHVDIVDDGEKLTKVKANSQDFIIANHFIEHCLDPIGTIENLSSKLKDKGVLYMAIPEKTHTFDLNREVTSFDHLVEEYKAKGTKFLKIHTIDYVRLAEKFKGDIEQRTQEIIDSGYRIHYHVWDTSAILQFFTRLINDFNLDFKIESAMANNNEVIVILRKVAGKKLSSVEGAAGRQSTKEPVGQS